jgi:hypothetical protein
MRPGSSSSTSCASRTATGVRPLSSMRPLSSYRIKTAASRGGTRPNSRHSLNSSSSSRMSSSPPSTTPPYSANSNNFYVDPIFDVQHSDASHLTVGPTFQGNPLKSLLARKKNGNSVTISQSNSFTIQTNSELKLNRSGF